MTDDFLLNYRPSGIGGLPKYAQLREALVAAIDDGYWEPGAQLPNETTLAELAKLSLGTVQKAMRDLVDSGRVIRRQGHGTFVAARRSPMDAPLHFRFESDSGEPLSIFPKVVWRAITEEDGPWCEPLNLGGEAVVRIDRVTAVGEEFLAYTRFYAAAARYPALVKTPERALDSINFKTLLRREHNVRIRRLSQKLHLATFPEEVYEAIGVESGTLGLILEVVGRTDGNRPVYYLEGYIPPNARPLILPETTELE